MDLYKGFYPRSRQAGSLSSAGAQQGSVLARLADCAQLGASRMAQGGERRQWGETAVKKEQTQREDKKRQDSNIKQSRLVNVNIVFAFPMIFMWCYTS